jgi:hypothetical protein
MAKSLSLARDKKFLSWGLLLFVLGWLFLVFDFKLSFEGNEAVVSLVDVLPDIIGSLLVLIGSIFFLVAKSKISETYKVFSWVLLVSTIISFLFNTLKFFKYEEMNGVIIKLFNLNDNLLFVLFAIVGMGIAASYAKKMVRHWKFFVGLLSIPLIITFALNFLTNLFEVTTKTGDPINDITVFSGSLSGPFPFLFLLLGIVFSIYFLWVVLKTKKLIKKG